MGMTSWLSAAVDSVKERLSRREQNDTGVLRFVDEPDADSVIEFRLLDALSPGAEGPSERAANVCPVTRQPLRPEDRLYRCRNCHLTYSLLGWDFLKANAHGQCCGCGARDTVFPLVSSASRD